MFKAEKMKKLLIYCLAIAFALSFFCASIYAEQPEPFQKIHEKLDGISEAERKILQTLFVQLQEIEAMEGQEAEIAREIETINRDIDGLEVKIEREEAAYEKKREDLKRVLQTYQKRGPGSYLEIILDSDSLTTFLRRINTLRDLTRNTGKLLELLEESKGKLLAEKARLAEKLVLVGEKHKQLKEALNKKLQLKEEQETYLTSLKEERVFYQTYLADVQKLWDELKRLFPEIEKAFSNIIEEDNVPPDALKIVYSLFSIKGSIDEKTFNDIASGQPELQKMVFDFSTGRIEMKVPEKNLVLSGAFVILEGHTLKFEVKEGNFYGMPLEPETIEDLFSERDLMLDLEPMLGKNILQAVEIQDDKIELTVKPVLF